MEKPYENKDSNSEEKSSRQKFVDVYNDWRQGCIANRVVNPEVERQFRINYYRQQRENN